MELAPGDDRVVEDGLHRAGERLGAIEDAQDRPGDTQSPVTEADQKAGDKRRVLGVALDHPEGVLHSLDVDADRHHTAVTCEVDPVDHEGDEIEPAQVGCHQLGQCRLGGGHEAPGDRRAGRAPALRLDRGSHRLQPGAVAAGRDLGQHLLHGHASEQLGRTEGVVGGEAHLGRTVRRAHPGTADRHLAPTEGDQPVIAPMAHGGPVGVVVAFGPTERLHLVLHHRVDDLEAGSDDEGEQPLLELGGELTDGDADRLGQHERRLLGSTGGVLLRLPGGGAAGGPGATGRGLVVLHVGGPFPDRMS